MFTPDRLRNEWHCEGVSEQDLSTFATSLNVVDRHLGEDGIDSYVDQMHVVPEEGVDEHNQRQVFVRPGRALISLRILSRLGALLAATQNVPRFPRMRNKLKAGYEFSAAWSEILAAEHFLSAGFKVEFSPSVNVNGRRRVADLAIIVGTQRIIAEVHRPSSSKWQHEAAEVMQRILGADSLSVHLPRGHQVSIALRHLPTMDEEADLMARIGRIVALARHGVLVPTQDVPQLSSDDGEAFAQVHVSDHVDQKLPAVSSRFLRGRGSVLIMATTSIHLSPIALPPIWAIVGVAFDDTRGYSKLEDEVAQLPNGEPSLIIIDTSETPGVAHAWRPAVEQFVAKAQVDSSAPPKPSAIWFIGETITPDGPVRLSPPVAFENPGAPELPDELRSLLWKQG